MVIFYGKVHDALTVTHRHDAFSVFIAYEPTFIYLLRILAGFIRMSFLKVQNTFRGLAFGNFL
jgi:hypothetical protein